MKRKFAVLLIWCLLMLPNCAAAAADSVPRLIVNGYSQPAALQVVNGVTYMQITARLDFTCSGEVSGETLYCAWDNAAKAVILTRDDGSRAARFPVDSSIAWINGEKQSIPHAPFIRDGRVWLPLRSAAEAMGMRVKYIPAANCIVIWTPAAMRSAVSDSEALAAARQSAITAPRICLHDRLQHQGENPKAFTYTFPRGRSDLFCYTYGDIETVYAVQDGAAWAVWQSQTETGAAWGDKPDFGTWQAWFFDYPFTDMVRYGFVENGQVTELGALEATGSVKITAIPGELTE